MARQYVILGLLATFFLTLAASCNKDKQIHPGKNENGHTTTPDTGKAGTISRYMTKALETHAYITSNLLTTNSSYRANNSTLNGTAYEWYNVSQIYADAAMVKIGQTSYLISMNNTYNWMAHLWDTGDPNGGYFAVANIDGTGAGGSKFVDDNALTGIIYLDAYDVTTGSYQAAYLASAVACANWLIKSGQWDSTFGGGFWWNTDKTLKPTQSNGLCMQLFLRLYKITGQSVYSDWANMVKAWLESTMYDSASNLYIWEITGTGTGTRMTTKFTYDNAIMIEADLLYASVMGDNTYLAKAQTLGMGMYSILWNNTYHSFIFNTGDPRVNPAWCSWGTQAMIKLYEADKNAKWLTYAQSNIDAINAVDRDPVSHGYYYLTGFDGSGKTIYDLEGVDQAWMQRTQALLSQYK